MSDYDLQCWFGSVTTGINAGAGQYSNGYDLHADTRSNKQVSWRKKSVNNLWVEGDFDVSAVRGNITELVAVWVYGNDVNEYRQRKEALVAYLAQGSWPMIWQLDGMTETWDCTYSDYTEETQREFQYARQGIVRMNIMRRPSATIVYSNGQTVVA